MFIRLRFENVKSQQSLLKCEVTAMFIWLRFENVKSQQCLFACVLKM